MKTRLTQDDERALAACAGSVSREAFVAAREAEESEVTRLQHAVARDAEGLSAADREMLRRNPALDRKTFVAARREEIERASVRRSWPVSE